MSTTVIYIAPTPGYFRHSAQCYIYRAEFEGKPPTNIAAHYREHSDDWEEIGLMNFDGRIVYLSATAQQREELLDSQPLMAGTTFTYSTEDA